jgi:hypothetical protein
VHRGSSFSVVPSSTISANAKQTVYRRRGGKLFWSTRGDLPFQGASNSGPISILEPSIPEDDVPDLLPTPR